MTPCQSGVATWNLDLGPPSCPLVLAASILNAAQQTVLCRAHVQRRLGVLGGLGRVRDDGSQRAFIVAATIAQHFVSAKPSIMKTLAKKAAMPAMIAASNRDADDQRRRTEG